MARWKLSTPHYLLMEEPSEWEYHENDRKTGKTIRKRFTVPTLLDPRDPTCWNYSWGLKDDQEGEIIVCLPGKGQDRDVGFLGDPTPDMIPLDDEAKELSASFESKWKYKPETDNPGEFSQSLIDKFQEQMAEAQVKPVQIEGISELTAAIAKTTEQNAQIIAALVQRRV